MLKNHGSPNALMFTFRAELLIASVIVFRVVYSRDGASQFAFYGEFITGAIASAKMIGFKSHAGIYGAATLH